ncbi:MAG: aminopeptidase P N-terminal domain-containing protein [Lysobacterales bacterium]
MNAIIAVGEYARRRRQLSRMIGRDAIAIVPTAPERVRTNDTHYPYRQDSDFHYLTGFGEPDAVLALVPGREHGETILFCRERDPERERWDGARLGLEQAPAALAVDDAFPIDDIDEILPGLIEGRSRVYYHFGRDSEFDLKLIGWVNRVRAEVKKGARPPHEFVALGHVLHDLRLYKSRAEVRAMQRAADISAAAHQRAMRITRPGISEAAIEAELQHSFRSAQAEAAYPPIVGGGANACVLHYRANNAPLRDGDLVLVDAGAEFQCYASDITRTWPVNGRWSPEQRALYELVLEAQLAAIDQARVGLPFNAMHDTAVEVIVAGLCRLGLLGGSRKQQLAGSDYKRFYMHKTGHWIGLDVHDVGDYRVGEESRLLEAGMVVTVEPGLYIAADEPTVEPRWRGIGIRIEDDVLISRDGPKVLSRGITKDPDAIAALVGRG